MDRIKLLVVDNSIFFRELMSRYIQQDYSIEIVGKAGDAYSARDGRHGVFEKAAAAVLYPDNRCFKLRKTKGGMS